ncbi:hypothetical protein [Mycobacterium sp. KBS0706]|uniref:hypothetical protein n=1 Tax=Mycobacterium sp. KBS0706 TaxID=2578109 RepID=UPI00163D8B6F|nr:hypothetical protein [Mycobacterium sp. KBS0706]
MAITPTEAPRPGSRPKAPPPAPTQQGATTTRPNAPSQPQGDEIAGLLDGAPSGRTSSRSSTRPPRATGQGGPATRISVGEQGAIRDKIRGCWNIDAQALGGVVVQIRVSAVQPDGTILSKDVSIADNGGNQAAANAARRAVLNPTCQPWPAPSGGWPNDTFLLVFDPKDFF